jgi:predicted naringenin-chalcone synthase
MSADGSRRGGAAAAFETGAALDSLVHPERGTSRPRPVCVHRPCYAPAEYPATLDEVVALAAGSFDQGRIPEKFVAHMRATGVATRRFIRPPKQVFTDGHGPQHWPETVELLTRLAGQAATQALDQAGLAAHQIDALVVTSVSGYAMPGVDAALIHALGLDPAVRRVPVAQIGCAGGLYGIIRAREQVLAYPGSRVLVVASEAFSTVLQPGNRRLDSMIYKALGGDGATATVVTDAAQHPADVPYVLLDDPLEYLVPGTADNYRLSSDAGGYLGFASTGAAPAAIRKAEAPLRAWLGTGPEGSPSVAVGRPVGFMVAHHGGPKVLENTAAVFDVDRHALRHSWDSLSEEGNMGSATFARVLERTLDERGPDAARGAGVALSIGPGVTLCAARLTRP